MFLSLTVFAILKGIPVARRKSLAWFLISLILVAILLLQCRARDPGGRPVPDRTFLGPPYQLFQQ